MSWKESDLVLPHVCLGRTKDTAVLKKRQKTPISMPFSCFWCSCSALSWELQLVTQPLWRMSTEMLNCDEVQGQRCL